VGYKRELKTSLQSRGVKIVSVDVFDTILWRLVQDERIQFMRWSVHASSAFAEVAHIAVDSAVLFNLRVQTREALRASIEHRIEEQAADPRLGKSGASSIDPEVGISEWFVKIIDWVLLQAHQSIDRQTLAELLDALILIEIQLELKLTRPNRPLLRYLKRLKEDHNATLIFVSDMYLRAGDVEKLLESHGIDFFESGLTSGDTKFGKWSGKMFSKGLGNQAHSIVHIGNDRHSDFVRPRQSGLRAVHYRSPMHLVQKVLRPWARARARRLGVSEVRRVTRSTLAFSRSASEIEKIGMPFGLLAGLFVFLVNDRAKELTDRQFVFVSSEALTFERVWKKLDLELPPNVHFAPNLNRRSALFALIRGSLQREPHIVGAAQALLTFGESNFPRSDLVRVVGGSPAHLLEELMSDSEFAEYFSRLESTSSEEPDTLPDFPDTTERIVLVDVGWGGTIQALLNERAALEASSKRFSGLYLAARPRHNPFGQARGRVEGLVIADIERGRNRCFFIPELWEFILHGGSQWGSSPLQVGFQAAVLRGVSVLKQLGPTSPDAVRKVALRQVSRILSRPSISEIEIFGGVVWERGFTRPESYPIVDTSVARISLVRSLLLRPFRTLRELVNLPPHLWREGYFRYHYLHRASRLIRAIRRLSKKG